MTETKLTGRRVLWLVPVGILLTLAAVAVGSRLVPDHRAGAFVAHWAKLFQDCPDIASIQALPTKERPDCIFIRAFTNGQWVAVRMEHSCCSGAGFDASVFVDSTRTIRYDTTHTFCGNETLSAELGRIQAAGPAGFYASLTNLTLQTWARK